MLTALLGVVFLSVPSVCVEPRSSPIEPPSVRAPAAAQDERVARETLPNGFEVLSLADGSVGERVFGTLFVRCGRLDELEGQEGAADLLAATWIAGGSAESSGESLQAWLEEHGASLEVSAESDHLSIDFHCAPGDLRALYGKLVDLLATPRYPEVPFEAARESLAEATDGDDEEREPFRVLERFALTSSVRAGRLATRASVLALDREEVLFFHKVFLVADRMLLGLCGAVNAEVLEFTREFAERVPAVETRARDWSTYLEAPKRTIVFLAPGDDAHLWVVAPVPGPGETDHALLRWALAGQVGAAADGATVERRSAAGLARTELPRVLVSTEWLHASLRVDSGFESARVKDALAELARLFAPAEFAALHARAKLAAILEARAPRDVTTPRGTIERALLDAIRHSSRTKPAVEPTPEDLAAAAGRWFDPARLWVLATGPVDRLRKELEADYDVRLLDAAWSVASTLDGAAKLDRLFAALGGRARWRDVKSLATEGEAVLKGGEPIFTRQVRDFAGARLWQEQKRAGSVDVTVLDPSGATTFRGANAQRQSPAMHARLVRRSACHLYQLLHDLARGEGRGVRLGSDGALEILSPSGVLCWLELDETNRPKRLGWTEDNQGDGAVFVYGDWKEFDGFPYPATVEQPEAGVRTTTRSLQVDVPLEEALFRRVR